MAAANNNNDAECEATLRLTRDGGDEVQGDTPNTARAFKRRYRQDEDYQRHIQRVWGARAYDSRPQVAIDEKTEYQNFFNNNEMVFYKSISDLSEKIIKISADEKLRKKIGKNGKKKYMKYFNSDLVSEYIISKTLDLKSKKQNLWEK